MIRSICICGSGTMGSGIAQVAAESGISVRLYDMDEESIRRAKTLIEKNLESKISKHKISESEKGSIISLITYSTQLSDCRAELVLEAIVENLQAKKDLLIQLEKINDDKAIFASNTSSHSISEMADSIRNPGRMIGMHFFNPPTMMKLVEIILTAKTSDVTKNQTVHLAKRMGKTPVICNDSTGFIVNHVARPYYLEALRLLEKGRADLQTVDQMMEASGFKMGPFRLMDLIGNDINYAVSRSIFEGLNHPSRLEPSSLQLQKLERGELGRKSGIGFYNYQGQTNNP